MGRASQSELLRAYGAAFGKQSSALTTTSFDVLRSAVVFYIKSPLRVEEAGLQELIPTTWWPRRSNREVGPLGQADGVTVGAGPGCPSHLALSTQGPFPGLVCGVGRGSPV